ncbi:MAG: LysM peptidoglycan-binding domain-containing protein [Alistipes sp.]|nr:LysM peptidoglycan-binding domain-containing protein [Alistipes sp.]
MRYLKLLFLLLSLTFAVFAMAIDVQPVEKSTVIVFINGQKFYVHTVKTGDTLYSLAKTYEVSEELIRQHNANMGSELKIDQTVKIPVPESAQKSAKAEKRRKRDFLTHKVQAGQTLYAIARDYNISVATLREDNPSLNPQSLPVGETLWIRRAAVGKSNEQQTQAEIAEYAATLNSVTDDDGYDHHVVQPGETIYSLSRRFGITEEEFARLNDVSAGLKAGAMIRIPRSEQAEEEVAEVEQPQSTADVHFRALASTEPLNVALMLPMNIENRANASYVEFYQGFLLGMETLKNTGRGESKLTVYNTSHDQLKVDEIVRSTMFEGTNLIVGPVYEDELAPVIRYAEQNSVPVVSPLANISAVESPALYQLSPSAERKYDKVADLVNGEREIFMIYADSYDEEFEAEAKQLLHGRPYHSYTYSFDDQKSKFRARTADAPFDVIDGMDTVLMSETPRLFIVLANKEVDVDRILGTISSSKVAISERSIPCAEYTVLGTSRWGRFSNIDHTTYFNNNVVMISTYHAKRDAQAVREFDRRYIEAYGGLPSLYAYRGYDAAILFCGGMRGDIEYNMLDKRYTPLQTVYKFVQEGENGKYVNQEWMRINYNSNYTITVE